MKYRKYIPLCLTLVLTGCTWFYIREQLHLYQKRPSRKTWSELHSRIYNQSLPYDVISFDPPWLVGYATDLQKFNFLDIADSDKVVTDATEVPERLWFVSLKNNSKILSQITESKFSSLQSFKFNRLNVTLLKKNDGKLLYNFTDKLHGASAKIENDGSLEIAVKKNGQFQFQSNPLEWNHIRKSNKTFSFGQERRNAISFHPVRRGIKLLEFNDVPRGDHLHLLVFLSDSGRKYDAISSVSFIVRYNGIELLHTKIDENNPEEYMTIPLSNVSKNLVPTNDPEKDVITFEVRSNSDDIEKRHIYFSGHITKNSKH